MNKVKYTKEIKQLRKLLADNEYTRTLSSKYHQFLSDMHLKMVSASRITPKMEKHINQAFNYYENHKNPEMKIQRESMLAKITKLKYLLTRCGYTKQYEADKMFFLDGLTDRINRVGTLSPKQAKYANQMYKQFNKKILPKSA
tara:strand:- start:283 stop:711 length:429 start_codon:yes stop_codon:yes gene_type:complete